MKNCKGFELSESPTRLIILIPEAAASSSVLSLSFSYSGASSSSSTPSLAKAMMIMVMQVSVLPCLREIPLSFQMLIKETNLGSFNLGGIFQRLLYCVPLKKSIYFVDRIGNYTDGSVSKTLNSTSSVFPQATEKENNFCLLRKGQLQDVYEHVLVNNALLICKVVLPERRISKKTLEARDPRYVNLEDKSLKVNGSSQLVNNGTRYRLEPDGNGYNYASAMKGAKVVDHNKEAKGASNVLGKDHDKYLRNPCSVSDKYVVIELAEETLVDTVRIANFEHYSSNPKEFSLSGSLSFPSDMWTPAGSFAAANVKQIQSFRLPEPKWLRYLKLNLVSHYGSEFYCTLSVVEVFGIDALEQMLEDLFVPSETPPSKPAMVELKTADEKQDGEIKSNRTDQIGKETEAQKKKDDVVKTINIIGDKKYEVKEKHNVLKVMMQKVKLIEMNLSLLEDSVKKMNDKQPEVSLEMKKTLVLVEKSKADIREITEWKGKMEKELRDLELWKTLVASRVESLARGNSALRLDVEKIVKEQANLESKELGVLLISLFFVVLATIRLVSTRLWAFLGMSITDKARSLWPDSGWVMILLSSSIMIFIHLLS
jgi:hypothetical protein